MEWVKAVNQAISYMEENLFEDITCESVADHVYLSSFHFQRTFAMLTELTVGEYIRNRRLSLAGEELVATKEKIIDIALKYGYQTPESFTKAFTRFHGVTPSEAKKEGAVLKSFPPLVIKIILEGGTSMDYQIVKKDAFQVVVKSRIFKEETSATEIPKFWTEYFNSGVAEKVCGAMGICAAETCNKKDWKYGIGCDKKLVQEIPDGFEVWNIPANTWAIFHCVGAMPKAIQAMWKRIYSEWLPSSNYELLPDYDIEFYTEGDNSSEDYVSEIWIPVKEKQ
ncbi:AraC family transcriptional regulator [Paludicola sp. MB14-C6]|uniref:AraC family transcriptional regulator n=1 Tax=Paludihabitans sp. MB14-C6 TaxID=3070656 RepID=UPI0027DB5087|nr:AraC family transcriptional regulator [Paludicola sp. MB14-C6]WMJ21966.1 AraC family transcriptional regulator [Paludicola sp. MB14-C6]